MEVDSTDSSMKSLSSASLSSLSERSEFDLSTSAPSVLSGLDLSERERLSLNGSVMFYKAHRLFNNQFSSLHLMKDK